MAEGSEADDGLGEFIVHCSKPMSVKYQFSDNMTINWLVQQMPQFLFPNLSKQQARIEKPFCGILATFNKQPIGLILATSETTRTIFRIHSFLVHPQFRRKGIGKKILQNLTTTLQQKGAKQIEGTYKSHWASFPIIENMLENQNWQQPQKQLLILKGTLKQARPYFSAKTNKFTFSFLPFTQLKKSDIDYIRNKNEQQLWFDPALHPFLAANSIHSTCSFIVKDKETIIGWLVAHQIKKDLNELTALFLDPNYRSFKLAYFMIKNALDQQLAAGIPNFMVTTKLDGNPIAKFFLRHLPQSEVTASIVFYSRKLLGA